MTTLNLRTIKLRSGEQFRDECAIRIEPLELGGQRYLPVPEEVPAELTITRAASPVEVAAPSNAASLSSANTVPAGPTNRRIS